MTENISILPVSKADLPILSDFLHTSKISLTINRLLVKDWPNEEVQRKHYADVITGSLQDASNELLKSVDTSTGQIAGFVVLTRKHPVPSTASSEKGGGNVERTNVPNWMNPVLFEAVMSGSDYVTQPTDDMERFGNHASSGHFYYFGFADIRPDLTYIFVAPSRRRQGIGSSMVKHCMDRARDANIPLTTVSEPGAYEFHRRAGFMDTRHVDFDLSQWAPPYSGFGVFRLAGLIWIP
jgi:ribosomal protein S18 acetylase RimI-like enzyme